MYIAIEGIKGTGKSSLLKELSEYQQKVKARLFPITGAMPGQHPLERCHRQSPLLKQSDAFLEKLFAGRAHWHWQQVCREKRILGDRSIATAYVSRWQKWGDPWFTIRRVEHQQGKIAKPDVVIWLQCRAEQALQHIRSRQQKDLGQTDECLGRLREAADTYEELFLEKTYSRKISSSDLIILPAAAPLKELSAEMTSILKFYYQS